MTVTETNNVRLPILCLDFDGVCHSYVSGWKGATVIPDPAVPGLVAFLRKAIKQFDVHIYSSRSSQEGGIEAMKEWLRYEIADHFGRGFAGSPNDADNAYEVFRAIKWPTEKPAALVTIDDRAVTFTGTWPDVQVLREFQPWNKPKSGSSIPDASRSVRPIQSIRTALTAMFRKARV